MKDEWLPIETASKDGTRILLFCARVGGNVRSGHWHDNKQEGYNARGWWLDGFAHPFNEPPFSPTHWQPLPDPPSTEIPHEGKGADTSNITKE